MKKHLPLIVSLACCLVSFLCLLEVQDLTSQLNSLRNEMTNGIHRVESSVQNISSHVSNSLEEQASLLASYSFDYQDANLDAGTVQLAARVSPKEYRSGVTSAVLRLSNGLTIALEEETGAFVALAELSLFEEFTIESVIFEEEGTLRTERLDWYVSPADACLPYLWASLGGTMRLADETFTIDGTLDFDLNGYDASHITGLSLDIQAMRLIQQVNNEEVFCHEFPMEQVEVMQADEYTFYGLIPLENFTLSWPNNTTQKLWLEMENAGGLRYRVLVDQRTSNQKGNMDFEVPEVPNTMEIYSSSGKLLYQSSQSYG